MVLARTLILILLFGTCSLFASAVEATNEGETEKAQVRIIALFENAAMIDFDGKQKLYRVGQNINPQIKLIKANTRLATLLIEGEEIELDLTQSRNIQFNNSDSQIDKTNNQSAEKVTRIVRNNMGMYEVAGSINGIAVPFAVDTGATSIAMNENYANLLGLPYKLEGKRGQASTAAGMVSVWHVTLDKVSVVGLELRYVEAVVIKGNFPENILLGMTFLNRVNLHYEGSLLVITKKY